MSIIYTNTPSTNSDLVNAISYATAFATSYAKLAAADSNPYPDTVVIPTQYYGPGVYSPSVSIRKDYVDSVIFDGTDTIINTSSSYVPSGNILINPYVTPIGTKLSITEHYYKKLYDNWIYTSDFADVLRLLTVKDKSVSVVNSKSDANSVGSKSDIELKIDYLRHSVMDFYKVSEIIEKFCNKHLLGWQSVASGAYKEMIKDKLHDKLISYLSRRI